MRVPDYVGYGNSNDEWCNLSELVTIPSDHNDNSRNVTVHSLYNELRIKIKQTLVCHSGRGSPAVTIDMGFDYLLFKGGLQAVGVAKQNTHGNNLRYKLRSYKDLEPLLGQNWQYRGANVNGDYDFVILHSIEYYIHKQRKITEYHPSQAATQSTPTLHSEDGGYVLKFCFTQGYGNRCTFGKDNQLNNYQAPQNGAYGLL